MPSASASVEAKRFETPDDERAGPPGLFGELKVRPELAECIHARLELDAGERGADADVNAAAEADVLGGVGATDVEIVGSLEDAGVSVRRAEEERQLRAERNRDVADRKAVLEHPPLEELERRVEPDQLLDCGVRSDVAVDDSAPLLRMARKRE